jgi:hypothetical protein
MRLFISADIHHQSLNTGNQQHSDLLELETAEIFCRLLDEVGLKYTLFFTGRCFIEHTALANNLSSKPNVCVGGHGWNGFQPEIFHRICNKLLGSFNGPKWYQHLDVSYTKKIIERHTGKPVKVWRNHMYMHGPYTESVLANNGITLCSDGVDSKSHKPVLHESGVMNYPLNIMPDHEHIYHAERTVEWVKRWQERYNWSDDFGCESYSIERWGEIVKSQINQAIQDDRDINMLIHPITMYLSDNFAVFKDILNEFIGVESAWLEDAIVEVGHNENINNYAY